MPTESFFTDICPSCSRANQIFIFYLGKEYNCRHCRESFITRDREAESLSMDQPICEWNHDQALKIDSETSVSNRPR